MCVMNRPWRRSGDMQSVMAAPASDMPSDAEAAFEELYRSSRDVDRNNLPVSLTSLIGRESERAEVAAALTGDGRLVTLTGPGGVGKTRLALQVAADCLDLFPDGVWWVELAALEHGGCVADVIVLALGLVESASVSPLDQLVAGLARWQALLVLDNCEHVLDDAARVVDGLLRGCRHLTVLTTSREPLATPGETVWPVPTLPVADADEPVASVLGYAAVRLFVERARQARPGFIVDQRNVAAVGEVCRRLDGIPLALELAAARVRSMPIQDIVGGLDDRFRLLTGGARTALPRHRTLDACLAWTYDLLSDVEQRVFRLLSVFVGGFTADAAAVVAGVDRYECADVLTHLVDKSVVQLDDRSDRYLMLETMRQYAAALLDQAGEREIVETRFVRSITTFVARAAAGWFTDPGQWSDVVKTERANIMQAIDVALGCGMTDDALRIVARLGPQWGTFQTELGYRQSRRVLDSCHGTEQPRLVGRVLASTANLGSLLEPSGDWAPMFERAVDVLEACDDRKALGSALYWYARFTSDVSVLDRAIDVAEDDGNALLLAWSLMNKATVLIERGGDLPDSLILLERARSIARDADLHVVLATALMRTVSCRVRGPEPGRGEAVADDVRRDADEADAIMRDLGMPPAVLRGRRAAGEVAAAHPRPRRRDPVRP